MQLIVLGSGWLGSATAAEARRQGHEVTVMTRSTHPQLTTTGGSAWLGEAMAQLRPDAIINAIGRLHGSDDELRDANAVWPRRIAEAVAEGTGQLIQIGSAAEYGPGSGRPISETDPTEPVSAYGRTKLEGSTAIGRILGPRSTVARVFNVFGPGAPPTAPIQEFALEARRPTDEPFVVRNGRTVRDYLPASFVASALVEMALRRPVGVVNVCSGRGLSFELIIEAMLVHEGATHRAIRSLDEPATLVVVGDATRLRTMLDPPATEPQDIATTLLT